MDGEGKEEVHGFFHQLIDDLKSGNLFNAVFKCEKKCRDCGEEQSVMATQQETSLPVSTQVRRSGQSLELDSLFNGSLQNQTIFDSEKLQCNNCKQVGH